MRIILIAFSGGRTSGYMTWWMLNIHFKAVWNEELKMHVGTDENGLKVGLIICFANTSKENPKTLEFVNNCDIYFGFHTVWLEGVWSEKWGAGNGTRHKIIDFISAKRNGEVYRSMIVKHGIPNVKNPICTREMKTYTIQSYLKRDCKLKRKNYETAIGYRADEPKRFNTPKKRKKQHRERQIYFLADVHPTTKLQVHGWWKLQPFDLDLEEHQGNCTKCFKKSENKLIVIEGEELKSGITDTWYSDIEKEFGQYIPPTRVHNKKIKLPMTFYRQYTTNKDNRTKAELYFKDSLNDDTAFELAKDSLLRNFNPKKQSRCAVESCEPF